MFLVNHYYNGQTVFFLGSACNLKDGGTLFGVAHHDVLFLVDAFPVDKQDFTRLDVSFRMVQFVIHHSSKLMSFAEEILHLEVTLLMKFVWSYPDVCYLLIRKITTRLQFSGEVTQHLRCHHSLSCTRWSLEDELLTITTEFQQIYRLFDKLAYSLNLVIQLFHNSSGSSGKSKRLSRFISISASFSSSVSNSCGLRLGKTLLYAS